MSSQRAHAHWHDRATGWISGAITAPAGALLYVVGGWWCVGLTSAASLLLGALTTLWLAWDEASR